MSTAATRLIRRAARARMPGITLAKRLAVLALRRARVEARVDLERGGVLYVDLANAVGRTIWLRRDYESEAPITALITENLHEGDVFLDVGANVGFFTVVAAQIVGPRGRVLAFEPLPGLASLLRRSVVANSLTHVDVVEAAVARSTGTASIAAMPDSAYSHLIDGARKIDTSHGGWSSVPVATVSIDEYLRDHVGRTPRLIKMDIEGAEVEALAGARMTLSADPAPDVICEVGIPHLARFGHAPSEVFGMFQQLGYRAFNPETRRLMLVEDLSPSLHANNVFFTRRNDAR